MDGDLVIYKRLYRGFRMLSTLHNFSNFIHGAGSNSYFARIAMTKFYCKLCCMNLDESFFYKRQKTKCIQCFNKQRRDVRPKPKCKQCNLEFVPSYGHYSFCSEKCRFINKVKKDVMTGCWTWQGSISLRGYGKFVISNDKRGALAHRVSYKLFNGPLEEKKLIIHSCDNTKCVNPEHLRLGTPKDNKEDARIKGRLKKAESLTENHVLNIRKLYHEGTSTEVLAKMYKRTQGTIMDIVYRVSWKEI